MNVTEWLLDSDPAIRWQVMRDLEHCPDVEVNEERARVATEGWGARLLELQQDDGTWAGGGHFPSPFDWSSLTRGDDGRILNQPWTATSWSLYLLRKFGLDPDSPQAREAIAKVREDVRWEYDDLPFFDGEVEPCINGLTVATGSYFGEDVSGIVDRLLGEQMGDGGWNCEQENGSTRGSFNTTISVLEGLLEFEKRNGSTPAIDEARSRGQEYLMERNLFRRLSTGEVIDEHWTEFSFPPWYRYDVLRGLEYFSEATQGADPRVAEALELVRAKRGDDGRWPREDVIGGEIHFDIDAPEGQPSRWNTLRSLRVLSWAGQA
ncbi:MAG TPA: hypothetical protein VFP42_03475 [Acidimicrobiia bacterium]|nr:hypothetical protein [Acidimicrobiia bacterium]